MSPHPSKNCGISVVLSPSYMTRDAQNVCAVTKGGTVLKTNGVWNGGNARISASLPLLSLPTPLFSISVELKKKYSEATVLTSITWSVSSSLNTGSFFLQNGTLKIIDRKKNIFKLSQASSAFLMFLLHLWL